MAEGAQDVPLQTESNTQDIFAPFPSSLLREVHRDVLAIDGLFEVGAG
jgi:hypothetical protein